MGAFRYIAESLKIFVAASNCPWQAPPLRPLNRLGTSTDSTAVDGLTYTLTARSRDHPLSAEQAGRGRGRVGEF